MDVAPDMLARAQDIRDLSTKLADMLEGEDMAKRLAALSMVTAYTIERAYQKDVQRGYEHYIFGLAHVLNDAPIPDETTDTAH